MAGAQDLRTRVALLALQELADHVSDALAGRAGRAALAALGDAYRSYAREHPGRWTATATRISADDTRQAAPGPGSPG